ncbi:hypothetical protein [Aeromicrobium chenweiae]|uniref:Uncharacterized protein n=1 Tax=Aeromicrobium chenweiae TaxID=2079793 RepID=A0A2S0WMM0_9ACTN|nr:hypothetical protein [Aeromicrobium chenweiae]AWB92557.1 hypothetical protein C3E78_10300 [Aeromicrobium chenweiae]TGN33545.1 hypothetical protein E4L97_00340 [Aeromicrobium chenweiae]
MSAEVWILVATAVLAAVAITAALIAVRAVRTIRRAEAPAAAHEPTTTPSTRIVVHEPSTPAPVVPDELAPRVVEGRLVVPPSQQQVVQAALGRPGVRLSVYAHGFAHALRAESRDRIAAMMRREYRRRRRERLQAGRRAVRSSQPSAPSDQWLGS